MGTPPAPSYAYLSFAIHKNTFLDKFNKNLIFYERFIDNVIGIWISSNDNAWNRFQCKMNESYLEWEFSNFSNRVDFMDMTITLVDGKLTTTLFEKALNLYLY